MSRNIIFVQRRYVKKSYHISVLGKNVTVLDTAGIAQSV
jgi:hypothetical protein